MVEAGAKYRGWSAVILGCSEYQDAICLMRLIDRAFLDDEGGEVEKRAGQSKENDGYKPAKGV